MEIQSFGFGMLAMIAVALVAVVIVGIVKLIKLQTRYVQLVDQVDNLLDTLDARISEEVRTLSDIIAEDRRELFHELNNTQSLMDARFADFNGYVDSRFDKLQNKLIEKKESKELLRG
jgi:hypothetical protein